MSSVVFALALAAGSWAAGPSAPGGGAGVTVVKGVLCTAIADREAADPRDSGAEYEARMDRIYYWNAAEVSRPPRTIRHVWSREGKALADIKLNLKNRKARTWSSKQVFPGDWKVEAVGEDGEVLAPAVFKVR